MDGLRVIPFSPGKPVRRAAAPATQRLNRTRREAEARKAREQEVENVVEAKSRNGHVAAAAPKSLPARTGREIVAVPDQQTGTVWFDYTDLVHYFEDNRVPTGIQRVQIGIFRATLMRAADRPADRLGACCFDPQRRCWVALQEQLLTSVCRAACQAASTAAPGGEDETWRTLTTALRQNVASGSAAPFAPGDVLVNIGSSWWIADYLRFVRHLQRERGVLFASFVHDCIPLRVPETCSANLVSEFDDWFGTAMQTADFVLANSAHTARDIGELAPTYSGRAARPKVVRLDARFDDGPQPGAVAAARLDATTHAALGIRRPFALFVSTLEARKNHLFLFQCWQELVRRHGDAVPDLLCVGKEGWLFDYTANWLRVHPELARRVRLLGTLPDNDVAALYRTAEFTVYCSHYEGWGLPITESLCFGRVPIVPRHTSLPEAGGEFALYYEPGAHAQFCEHVETLMDRDRLAVLEADIQARYRPRAWVDVLGDIATAVRTLPPSGPRGPSASDMIIRPGTLYNLARRNANRDPGREREPAMQPGERLRHGIGWHAAEEWGGWSRLAQAQLLFALPKRTRDATLYAVVRGGPGGCQALQMQAGGGSTKPEKLHPEQRRLLRLRLDPTLAGREVLVTFTAPLYSLLDYTAGGDRREIGFGIEAVAVIETRDTTARLEFMEYVLAPA